MVARSLAEAWKRFVQQRAGKRAQAGLLGRFALGFVLGPWLFASNEALMPAWGQSPGGRPAFGQPAATTPIRSTSQVPAPQFGDPGTMARAKLRQARGFLDQGRFDDAARLAGEANAWSVQYTTKEDTPTKLLDEINRTRRDPKALLGASRKAMQTGELDRAEQLAKAAQTAQPTWQVWGDNPQKVMREIQAARNSMPKSGSVATKPPVTPTAPSPMAAAKPDAKAKDAAKDLVQQGRSALSSGKLAMARDMHKRAAALSVEFAYWEDSPEKLMADITRAEAKAPKTGSSGVTQVQHTTVNPLVKAPPSRPAPVAQQPATKEDPRAMLRQGRDLYKQGQFEEAAKVARLAKAQKGATFGLFEDSPDKLLQDVDRARFQTDHEEATRFLAEGRKLLASNDIAGAEALAYKAQAKRITYSVWDLGDRPQKLLADVQSAKDKQRKQTVPPLPGTAVVNNPNVPKPTGPTTPAGMANATDSSPMVRQLLVDARIALQGGDRARAMSLVQQAKQLNPGPVRPGQDSPEAVEREIQLASAVMPAPPVSNVGAPTPGAVVGTNPPASVTPLADPRKDQASLLLVQARQFQQAGRLVEARQKALESRNVGATFAPTEDSPESALVQLSSLCYRRVDLLVQQSSDFLSNGSDLDRFRKAEENLAQARMLAQNFGQDTQPMDARISALRQQQAAVSGAGHASASTGQPVMPVVPSAPVASLPGGVQPAANSGHQMLEQARQELRRGETRKARTLAESVFAGKYGLQKEAESLLRTIDAEDFGQQRITAQKAFDAGNRAMNRRDYGQAVAILRGLNVRLLEHDKQVFLNDLLSKPELRSFMGMQGVAQASDQQPGGMPPLTQNPGAPELLKSAQAMQDIKFQQLRQQSLEVQREASDRFKTGDTDRALEVLQDYLADLQTIQLDNDRLALLRRPVDARLLQFKTLKSQRDFEASVMNRKNNAHASETKLALMEQNKEKQVTDLMGRNKSSYEEGKYKEAEMYASAALELDPDNAAAAAAVKIARIQASQVSGQKRKQQRNDMFDKGLDEAEEAGPFVDTQHPVHVDPDRTRANLKNRPDYGKGISIRTKSEKEREIEHKLTTPVNLNFNDTPLDQVLDDLNSWHSINIVPDYKALESEGISLKRPVTIKLENVSLRSAMNLILKQLRLTYIIADEVLQITTERHATGKLVTTTYSVADLVIPIENSNGQMPNSIPALVEQQAARSMAQNNMGPQPFRSPLGLNNGQGSSNWQGSGSGQFATDSRNGTTSTTNRPTQTLEEALIKLITNTVQPQSWESMGGPGTIEYFPLTMALVINQAPDVQEQVLELLTALRRLQDQEVAIEVRFITIAETFFERIGLDFNINIKTDHETSKFEPQLTSGQFKPAGFVNDFSPDRFISGLTRAGTFTSDLDIPLSQDSFGLAIPDFGGFPTGAIANGGIELGLAFLSDIQVFLFLEAAQGDRRTNVMQAPKLTMFNGQSASLSISDNQFFVTNISGFQNGGQFVFIPQNFPLPVAQTQITFQPTISGDRRFVRLNLILSLNNLASATVPLFPIVLAAQPFFEGVGNVGNPVLLTQFVQQPTFTTIGVQTTVSVPDGGTVLMGGFKRMSEGRNEFGPPVLSKIPYINRLFKNVGYGREAESLMLMVTPRIIINEEEEREQTGVGLPPP